MTEKLFVGREFYCEVLFKNGESAKKNAEPLKTALENALAEVVEREKKPVDDCALITNINIDEVGLITIDGLVSSGVSWETWDLALRHAINRNLYTQGISIPWMTNIVFSD